MWECPDKFRPERFLGESGKRIRENALHSGWVPFNTGPRECLGIRMAYLELKIVLSVLLPRFDFHCREDFVPHPEPAITMVSANGMLITLTKK